MSEKIILVTGATGFIGNRLVRRLCESGYSVRAMVIDDDPLLSKLHGVNCEMVKGDITAPGTLRPCLEGVKTVFHLAAVLVSGNKELFHKVNYQGTENLVNAAVEAGVEHFVYISAAAAAYIKRTTYGESKLRSEALMKRPGKTRFTIIRPTLLYGAGGGQEFNLYANYLRRFPFIAPVIGMGKARKRPVWVEDIVDGLEMIIDKPVTYGKTYNFSGGIDMSMWEYTRLICRTFGINKPLVGIPLWLCNFITAIIALFVKNPILNRDTILGVTMDANFNFEEAARDIGYHPADIEEGLRKVFAFKD
ncbi:MAG: NAD-dependent epimerase/dehydratase family protein [Candidatus Omnitrophica bacterium]|nr:NAD-dependent epimerase/dehydratase family protein [Candidatus Omnitrophota bacterium]